MTKQAYLSRSAETDLIEIWVYVAENSVEAADRLIAKIRRQCQVLADAPGAGRRRDDVLPGIRSFPLGQYVLSYREADEGIEVARVLSGYRDLRRMLRR
ncbi:MAG TPA: type II toxin-antitoxin system RelE/ParE family toxin [Vicinamibacteria bacterium]